MYSSIYDIDKLYSKIKEYKRLIIFVFIIFVLFLFILNYNFLFYKKDLQIHFLNVGQGDSQLIITPNKAKIMIDTGPTKKIVNIYQNKIKDKTKIDALILSHQDIDHVGGAKYLIEAGLVKKVFAEEPALDISLENYERIYKDKNLLLTDVEIKTIWPEKNNLIYKDNQRSLVNLIEYGNFRFIFTGDIDKDIERKLISQDYFTTKKINILKVAHHGSETSSSELFLRKIKPEYCIISVGKDNVYNHPDKDALERLEKYCKSIYRTDLDGDISFFTDGNWLKIKKSL